nr:MAG TPA: hypothetical protein [Caudoviricetes sp.]
MHPAKGCTCRVDSAILEAQQASERNKSWTATSPLPTASPPQSW